MVRYGDSSRAVAQWPSSGSLKLVTSPDHSATEEHGDSPTRPELRQHRVSLLVTRSPQLTQARVLSPPMQGGRRGQALRHQQDGHGLRLRRALQPVRLPQGAGASLPAHVPRAAQRLPQRHTSLPGVRAAEAMKGRPPACSSPSTPRGLWQAQGSPAAWPGNWAADTQPPVCRWDSSLRPHGRKGRRPAGPRAGQPPFSSGVLRRPSFLPSFCFGFCLFFFFWFNLKPQPHTKRKRNAKISACRDKEAFNHGACSCFQKLYQLKSWDLGDRSRDGLKSPSRGLLGPAWVLPCTVAPDTPHCGLFHFLTKWTDM